MRKNDAMEKILTIISAVMFTTFCLNIYAAGNMPDSSSVIQLMESQDKTKKLEGIKLKMARPILKKTPMAAVIDDIEMLIFCPMNSRDDENDIADDVRKMLTDYIMVSEINEDNSQMSVYIDTPVDDNFSEIIMYIIRPEMSLMVFKGDFTIESMKEVGELSKQQRMKKRQSK